MKKISLIALPILCAISANALTVGKLQKVTDTNAHEGPVCVANQDRLYYTTKPDLKLKYPYISINYLDLKNDSVHTFMKKSNMANGMWLANDKKSLFVAEQGTLKTKSAITQINLKTKKRTVIADNYDDKPFNSLNKVIESKGHVLYFSDPDYGYNQSFKPKPQLPNAVYAYSLRSHQIRRLTTDYLMPHGLALSENGETLYIGDTEAIDAVNPYNQHSSRDIYSMDLITPFKANNIKKVVKKSVGIPDGFIMLDGNLFVSEGDGVHQYNKEGKLLKVLKIPTGSANLTYCNGYLYILADKAIYKAKISK